MKFSARIALLLVFVIAGITGGYAQQTPTASAQQTQAQAQVGNNVQLVIEGKVIRVSDGDTVVVLDKDNKQHKIRLQGIDAPESKQEFGQVSKDNLAKLVFGKQVTVLWEKVDKYRRVVGKILLDGRDINIEQLKAGLAWHYKKYESEQPPADRVTYAEAERVARGAQLGLWKDPNPTPPSEWRQEVREERAGPLPPAGSIVGNRNSKKYHLPGCPGYRDVSEKNRVIFQNAAEAEAAGYKRAGNCRDEDVRQTASSSTPAATPKAQSSPSTASTAQTATATNTPVAASTPVKAKGAAVATPAAVPTTSTSATTTSATGPIIGNKNSKIFHLPGCPGYDKVSEKNQVKFQTAAEAEAAGYRQAKNCQQK